MGGMKLIAFNPPSSSAVGAPISGGTEGSVLFLGAGGILAQDNANFKVVGAGVDKTFTTGYNSFSTSTGTGSSAWAAATFNLSIACGTGGIYLNGGTNGVQVAALDATSVPLRVNLKAAQTADAFQVYASDGTTKLMSVSSTGKVTAPVGAYPSTAGFQFGTGTIMMSRGIDGELIVSDAAGSNAMTFSVPNQQFSLGSANSIGIASTSHPAASGSDIALARYAAGIFKVTDGSTGIKGFLGGGASVASAAALPAPTGNIFHVTGTTGITSITSTNFQSGAIITLIFDGVLTVTDGSNLKLAGNFTTTADDTLTLGYDGTNWYEICRSVN